jgi:DNA polymerase-1
VSEDRAMIDAFLADKDIHSTTAAAVFGVGLDDVTPELRRRAKAINFGLIYGMSPYGLSRATDLTLAEAEDFVEEYFKRFPGVQGYLEQTRAVAAERGYVETVLGRRRYFPELKRGGRRVSQVARSRALREAVNAPIQGSAADIIKLAMLDLPSALLEAGLGGRMLLQVHDELVLECPAEEVRETAELVKRVMQEAYTLKVPLRADAKQGANWLEMASMD